MATWKSEDEALAEYRASMGDELGPIFAALSSQVTWIHWVWAQIRELFEVSEKRVAILNDAAAEFFVIVQRTLLGDMLLGMARIVGPGTAKGRDYLSLDQLPRRIGNTDLQRSITKKVAVARGTAEFATDLRNRVLAHHDLSLVVGGVTAPLPTVDRDRIEAALAAIRTAANDVAVGYGLSPTLYGQSPMKSDARKLLSVLREGLARERERHERLQRGELRSEDVESGEPI